MNRSRSFRFASILLLAGGLLFAASAGWALGKPLVAQVLLSRAWLASDHGTRRVTPWPSADMAPIAELRIPRLDASWIVLDDDSGQALAFGPGWNPASAPPASRGLTVISAHRDTQFSRLDRLQTGDRIELAGASGQRSYRVSGARVVDSRATRIGARHSADALLLVTCYPLDAVIPGGPLRYVVRALPVAP